MHILSYILPEGNQRSNASFVLFVDALFSRLALKHNLIKCFVYNLITLTLLNVQLEIQFTAPENAYGL